MLASAEIDVVTLTVTEKGYCHHPATGAARLAIADDRCTTSPSPATPASLPGLIVRALERAGARTAGR